MTRNWLSSSGISTTCTSPRQLFVWQVSVNKPEPTCGWFARFQSNFVANFCSRFRQNQASLLSGTRMTTTTNIRNIFWHEKRNYSAIQSTNEACKNNQKKQTKKKRENFSSEIDRPWDFLWDKFNCSLDTQDDTERAENLTRLWWNKAHTHTHR